MLFAETSLTIDPAWPWSIPGVGLLALAGVVGLLVLLTVWTYLGTKGSNFRRLMMVLALRLGALVVACLLVLRPSLAMQEDEASLPSKLIILVDYSQSMNVKDEFNDFSRWANGRRLLDVPAVKSALKRLSEQQRIEIVYYQGAEDVKKYDSNGQADGKRTEIGLWLHELWASHGREPNLRGLLLFTDGADNGTRYLAMEKAALFRGTCPINPFAMGQPSITLRQRDIGFVPNSIVVNPVLVPVKGKMTAKAYLNAPGYENSKVKVSLKIDDKLAAPVQYFTLLKTSDNLVELTCDAPAKAGEVKVTLHAEPLPGEAIRSNNTIETYATIIKEGVSILWVDRKRAWEPKFANRALASDRRFRVYFTDNPPTGKDDPYNFEKQHYDVIVIGDITASQFSGGKPAVFRKVRELVQKGTGLMMLGGEYTFGNSDWQGPDAKVLSDLLPVEMIPGHFEGEARATPKAPGKQYLLTLDPDPKENAKVWNIKFEGLTGLSKLKRKSTGEVLATRGDSDDPVLVSGMVVEGRVLAFAAEDTWRAWQRSKQAIAGHQRFWKQAMLWLAKQENTDSNVRITMDSRRLSIDGNLRLGFFVELIGKGGNRVENAHFDVKVVGPDKNEIPVNTSPENGKERGYFFFRGKHPPGEYRVVATAQKTKETGQAKFIGYTDDIENLRPAADHDFLRKLAQAGGGKFYTADEQKLLQYLEELQTQKTEIAKPKADLWPDWRRSPASDSLADQVETLWNSTVLLCFLLFAAFLCLEWYLRRRWGMV